MIQLIGPGGAGKTTTGAALGKRLGVRFIDLDAEFTATYGDISAYLGTHGYAAYAERNVRLYSDLVGGRERPDVVALSSGFMTYQPDRKTGKVQTWSVPKESQTDATEASFVSPAFSHADGRVWVNNADRAQIFRLEPATNTWENFGAFTDPRTKRTIGSYGINADHNNNLYMLDFNAGNIGLVARLFVLAGRVVEARGVLAPLHALFTNGTPTIDLQSVRDVLRTPGAPRNSAGQNDSR